MKKCWNIIKKNISEKYVPEHLENYQILVEKDQIYKIKNIL